MQTKLFTLLTTLLLPSISFAGQDKMMINATETTYGYIAIAIFIAAYILVIFEEFLHLRKSKPVILASGVIWLLVAILANQKGLSQVAYNAVRHNILDYAELFLFLLVAMTYINSMQERKVFESLRVWLVNKGLTLKQLFWVTGVLSFFISPIADNLTTSLIMCAVILAVGQKYEKFVSIACINVVVAANAGGAFSPFGDITTLMVWQAGVVRFEKFFQIFLPALVSYAIPAVIMSFAVPNDKPEQVKENISMSFGARRIILLFLVTIVMAISCHNYLHLPPVIGMMTGLSLLKLFGYYIKMRFNRNSGIAETDGFDVIKKVERAEWDTLLFFYGIILCVGGLATIGYLENVSNLMYEEWGKSLPLVFQETPANIMIGLLSAVVDNIPVMFAVLTMFPNMSEGQWLLATLTAGIGGSILSVGSAAGVALMGQARGYYTFFSHLKWSWVIIIGYFAGIAMHVWVNYELFTIVDIKPSPYS